MPEQHRWYNTKRGLIYKRCLVLVRVCRKGNIYTLFVGMWIGTATFEMWCWRRLLRVPWTARRSNQSILKEISPEYSLQGLMLKLKLPYFGYLTRTANSLEKTLMLGKIKDGRRRGWQKMRWLDGINRLDGGWDGWIAWPTRWRWIWANSWR